MTRDSLDRTVSGREVGLYQLAHTRLDFSMLAFRHYWAHFVVASG